MAEKPKKPAAAKKPRTTASVAAPTVAKKRVAKPKAKVTPIRVPHSEIAALAHHYWSERGYKHGNDREDWLRAEAALLGKAS